MNTGERAITQIAIREDLDVFDARRAAVALAISIGFSKRDSGEIAIVVSELATNIIKHGRGGTIALSVTIDPKKGYGVIVVAEDRGPPIEALATALKDGHTSTGPIDPLHMFRRKGIGAGLGAISRFSDQLEYSRLEVGNRFRVMRFSREPRPR